MALNVGLIFKVKRFNGSKIPDYEKWYGMVAYGVPALVPIAYLIHDQMRTHSIIGPAIVSLVNHPAETILTCVIALVLGAQGV